MIYKCDLCDGLMETDEDLSKDEFVVCPHCGIETRIIPVKSSDEPTIKQPQVVTPVVTPPSLPENTKENVSAQTGTMADLAQAEQLHLQATFRLNECQAHYKVYGSRLGKPAYDGLEFVNAALRLFPNNPKYLNTKALLLADGLGEMQNCIEILQLARSIAPEDIQIRQNLSDANAASENSQAMIVVAVVVVALLIGGIIIFVLNNN